MRSESFRILVAGMFLAAVVGIALTFAAHFLMSEENDKGSKPDMSEEVWDVVETKVSALDRSLQARLEALMTSIEALNSRITETEKKVEKLARDGGAATAPKVAAREGATQNVPLDEETLEKMIEKMVEEMKKRKEEKKKEEDEARKRVEWAQRAQRILINMLKYRIEQMSKKYNWDINKEEAAKAVLEENRERIDRIAELAVKGDIDKETLVKKVREVIEEIRTKLRDILTEEEMNELDRPTF